MFGAYLQVFKNDGKADFVLKNFRKHYPDVPVYLVSDKGDNFSDIADKYNCEYLHDNFNTGADPNGFNKEQTIKWIERVVKGNEYLNEQYMIYLEDDILIRSNNIKFDGIDIAGQTINKIPGEVIKLCKENYNAYFNTDCYGACGGAIYRSDVLQLHCDDMIKFVVDEWETLEKRGVKFGYLDMYMPVFYMMYGYNYTQNECLTECHRNPRWKETNHPIVHGKVIYDF